ncbi:hypothetical protein JCM4814A_18730 [Streptomyces phaeofaciens JCM 4814]|uniref:DUF3558 domain-containing protein n=1 Tax=Streptomyces phaeofaciens TaxID=68254 RepID=A0A918HGS6_9ACTN|nr:DUF3558 domain-containing protein [Streptomyces phaeofaciens]GGT57583.1 hypothetical protein GCM10010226_38630 [Streptomyces phaeofaciens]
MQRKAYVTGVAALLAALLAGCTSGSDDGGPPDNSNPGEAGTASVAAQPGKYDSLPEACGVVSRSTLDSLLPGIEEITDEQQRETAYAGEATLTFDTDRKVGCRWKVQSTDATDHLLVDFERVVSYTNAVSDDSEAEELFARKVTAADLPEPAASGTEEETTDSASPSAGSTPSASASATPSGTASASASATGTPADLQPRLLDDLGDEAFVDDVLASSGSTAKQRTVTVAFRTSNVIVTIEYDEQPGTVGTVPDSKEMQDKARKLASQLADSLA